MSQHLPLSYSLNIGVEVFRANTIDPEFLGLHCLIQFETKDCSQMSSSIMIYTVSLFAIQPSLFLKGDSKSDSFK